MSNQPVWDILSSIIIKIAAKAKVGITTGMLDAYAALLIRDAGCESVNKGYTSQYEKTPFPAYICTSVNSVIGHGIPSGYVLQEGDILNIDMGIRLHDMCADAALTIPIGKIDKKKTRLLHYAKKILYFAIDLIEPGLETKYLAQKIEQFAMQRGYVTNFVFSGHGIGKEMHMPPRIYNSVVPDSIGEYTKLKVGDIICIEPMITLKDTIGVRSPEGWAQLTRDGEPSAYFEHMVKVTENGHEILTSHIAESLE